MGKIIFVTVPLGELVRYDYYVLRGNMYKKFLRICGTILLSIFLLNAGALSASAVEPLTWNSIIDQAASGGQIALNSDITLSDADSELVVKAGQNVTLTGSGKVTGAGKSAIRVEKGGKLILAGPSFTQLQFIVNGEMDFKAGAIHDTSIHGPVIFVDGGTLAIANAADFSHNDVTSTKGALQPQNIRENEYAPITCYTGNVQITGGIFQDNRGFQRGGVLGIWGSADNPGKLEISGGTFIKNLASHPNLNAFGGAIYAKDSDVTLKNGVIKDNSAEMGGGAYIEGGHFTMDKGTFRGNNNGEYSGKGGALYLSTVDATISGGKISENKANGFGGGIYAWSGTTNIKGGTFSSNTALKSGGGIAFMDASEAKISAAIIENNRATGFWGGGGIYNDNKATLTMLNTAITGNSIAEKTYLIGAGGHPVSKQGGGLWNCPYGSTIFHITNGVAIFDNKAPNACEDKSCIGAGDDFASITTHFATTPKEGQPVTLSERMLGGGKRAWFQDGSIYGIHGNWDKGQQLPRYIAGGENTLIPFDTPINENKAFKSVPSADAKGLANKLATVVVRGNVTGNDQNFTAGLGISGGGITNNGKLIFGTPDTWKLRINKAWQSDDPAARPAKLEVDVLIGGFKVDHVTLSQKNNWSSEVLNFPKLDTLKDPQTGKLLPITFRESGADGYTLSVTSSTDEKDKVYIFNLVNRILTEVPVEKVWDDANNADNIRPDSITVELLANGEPMGKELTLNAANSWKAKFIDLPKYKDGKVISYSVREKTVAGYKAQISGDAAKGFVVKNIHEPTTPPPLPKTGSSIAGILLLSLLLLGGAVPMCRKARRA